MKIISQNDENAVEIAIEYLKNAKVIFFATDTVYGAAVDASSQDAVAKLYEIKNRQKNKPIAIFIHNVKMAQEIFEFSQKAQEIADEFLPGALTVVLKTKNRENLNLAKNLNENDEFLGFRIVKNGFIEILLEKFAGILAVTSANISGCDAAICADDVKKAFKEQKSDFLLIDGGICKEKIASTVIKIDGEKLETLRLGAIKNHKFCD